MLYKKLLFIIITAFCLPLISFAQNDMDLHLQKQGNQYKLMWVPKTWKDHWKGIHIQYKLAGTNQWVLWNETPIKPGIIDDRGFQNLGMSPFEEIQLRNKFQFMIDHSPMPPEVFMNALANSEWGLPPREALCMYQDFYCALTMGLGAIVQTNNFIGQYEFGIFPALENQNIGNEPIVTQTTEDQSQYVLNNIQAQVEKVSKSIKLTWQIPSHILTHTGVFGFNVYKIEGGKANLLIEGIGPLPGANEISRYAYGYVTERFDLETTFRIAPITMFKEEIAHLSLTYNPEPIITRNVADFLQPVNSQFEGGLLLKIDPKQLPLSTKSIRIERMEPHSGIFQIIAQNLLPQTTSFLDSDELEFGMSITYRAVAILLDNSEVYSNNRTVVSLSSPKPPEVLGVSANLRKVDNNPVLQLSWQPIRNNKPAIKGYRILSNVINPNEFQLHSEIPVIESSRFDFPLTAYFSGKKVTFQIVAITEFSQIGDEGGFVIVDLPKFSIPRPTQLQTQIHQQTAIRISWEYNPDIPIRGFKILANNNQIAGLEQLRANARTFVWDNPRTDNKGNLEIKVIAISQWTESDHTLTQMSLPAYFVDASMRIPTGISVRQIERNGRQFAEFTWTGGGTAFGGKAIMLYADIRKEGDIIALPNYPTLTSSPYLFELTDPNRTSYNFRLSPIDERNRPGPISEIIHLSVR